jgi:hypothetical protein
MIQGEYVNSKGVEIHAKCNTEISALMKQVRSLTALLAWLGMTLYTYDIQLGEFESSFDETKQIQTWHCMGCPAEHFAKWSDNWKLNFVHTPECRYVLLRAEIEKAVKP